MEKYWISALARMRVCAMIVKRRKHPAYLTYPTPK